MATGFLSHLYDQYAPLTEKYQKIGWNTGNILFMQAIRSIIACEIVPHGTLQDLEKYDAIITADLIWIQENAEPATYMIDVSRALKDRPLVPICVGLQAPNYKPDFRLSEGMIRLLKEIGDRCVVAVRGEYTADILMRNGIRNIAIIGCPSLYQIPVYRSDFSYLRAEKEIGAVSGNYRSIFGTMDATDMRILRYIANTCDGFIEQTLLPYRESITDIEVCNWLGRHYNIFFDLDSWVRFNERFDFSFGLRFHGNVAGLLAGCRALFITFDSRTKEMSDIFKIPSIDRESFRTDADVQSHYEQCDYSRFIAEYPARMAAFESFLDQNKLTLSSSFKARLLEFGW